MINQVPEGSLIYPDGLQRVTASGWNPNAPGDLLRHRGNLKLVRQRRFSAPGGLLRPY